MAQRPNGHGCTTRVLSALTIAVFLFAAAPAEAGWLARGIAVGGNAVADARAPLAINKDDEEWYEHRAKILGRLPLPVLRPRHFAMSGRGGSRLEASHGDSDKSLSQLLGSDQPPADHVAVETELGLTTEGKALVQRGLAVMNYAVGPVDGIFGKKTRGAIRAWQEAQGLAETGYLTKEQAEALSEAGAEARERKGSVRAAALKKGPAFRVSHVFRDCPECPEMVVVPAGNFMMGSTAYEREVPQHRRVNIPRPFAVGKYEVTFAEWDACVAGGGCNGYRPGDGGWGRGRRPVIYVSWRDAKSYVEWLSRKTGERYRLLSEAEWEYVARAGTISTDQANYDGRRRTVHVGTFPANDFGLHDVHGNVWEWVEDCWHDNYSGAPTDGSAWTSGGDCNMRMSRGGSWNSLLPRVLQSARNWNAARSRDNFLGFRIARTLTP